MIRKVMMICFILIFLFLISAVSATSFENETIKSSTNKEKTEISLEKTIKQSQEIKEKVTLKTKNLNMYYQDGAKFNVNLIDKNNKAISNAKVKISINGVTYYKTTDNKGSTSLNINLKSGKYSISTTFDGTAKYQKQSVKNTVAIKSTIECKDFKKIYKNSNPYSAKFYDKKGKILKNTVVKFKINSKNYSVKTDKNGIAKLNINLNPGKYSISSINPKTAETITKAITITPLIIENIDLVKYYKNTKEFKVKIINPNGKAAGSGKQVCFTVNGITYKKSTDKNGMAKLGISLKPGIYGIKTTYDGHCVSNKINIKSLIETEPLNINYGDDGKFRVKILDSQGKPSSNQKVTLKLNGKTYGLKTDANGLACLDIDLDVGKYKVTTEYSDLKSVNEINVKKVTRLSNFTHTTLIPNYINVTVPYVFQNSFYSLKTGFNGIIKMPKAELFSIQIGDRYYLFSTTQISGVDSINIGYKSYLIPFDGGEIKSDINKGNLKGNGIIISRIKDYTQIDYVDTTKDNTELFGVYFDKALDSSETITYMQNDKIKAKVNFQTQSFDETGVKYSLSKYLGKTIYNINYNDIGENLIRYASTGEPVEFSYFGSFIVATIPKEEIITKFRINNVEELEKNETISYGHATKYNRNAGFEVLQAYAIISEKITPTIVESWISKNSNYLNRFGVMNVYGMFLASLETAWLADELASRYCQEFNVKWKRTRTLTILGGINLEDTYLHILNADMAMTVNGKDENVMLFRLLNSINLPNIEDYSLSEVAYRFMHNTDNSLDNVLESIANNNFSIAQLGNLIYVVSGDGKSAIILNTTSGISNVIISHDGSVYKGSTIATSQDCCTIGIIPKDIIGGIRNTLRNLNALDDYLDNFHTLSIIAYKALSFILNKKLTGAAAAGFGLFTIMALIQEGGSYYKEHGVDEKDWYHIMDTYTFTRPGFLQGKKVFNIPNENGGYDYIEVKIKDDLSLDRENAVYISDGNIRHLTVNETYEYFSEETYTPFAVPTKYWNGW